MKRHHAEVATDKIAMLVEELLLKKNKSTMIQESI
jgi:hypothetical protein